MINSLIDLKKIQSVSRTCASGVSYYISTSCSNWPKNKTLYSFSCFICIFYFISMKSSCQKYEAFRNLEVPFLWLFLDDFKFKYLSRVIFMKTIQFWMTDRSEFPVRMYGHLTLWLVTYCVMVFLKNTFI